MVYPHPRLEMPYAGPGSDEPAIVLREIGKSRVAYFPSDIDRCIWKYGNTDLSALLQNAVRWVTKDDSNVKVSGDGVAEVIAWETEVGYAIHILNYNNPNMILPWIRKHYPLGPQKATITLPGRQYCEGGSIAVRNRCCISAAWTDSRVCDSIRQ